MEMSTPRQTPRKSMAPALSSPAFEFTPLRKDRPRVSYQLEVNDDEAERDKRRRTLALRKSLLQAPPGTPSSTSVMNDSAILLSDDDARKHLQLCAKLYTENKLNTKNVWSLRITEALKQIVAKNAPDVLQVVGNNLEVAAKIYGLKVDDLHAEGLKFAAYLARNFDKRPREDNDEDEENIDPNAPPQEDQQKKKKQKKRRPLLAGGKKYFVNADPKSFQGPVPKLPSSAFSVRTDPAVSAVGNFFTNKVKMDPAGYKFMFMSKDKAWQWSAGNDPSVKMENNRKFPLSVKPLKSFKLCAPLKDFHLDEWDPDEETKGLEKIASISHRLDDVVFDDDGIPIPELDGSLHNIFEERENDDLNDGDEEDEQIVPLRVHQQLEYITEFRPFDQAASTEISEFSYNTLINTSAGKVDKIWAGPSHWKLKCIRRVKPVYTGRDEENKKSRNKKGKTIKGWLVDTGKLKPPVDFSLYEDARMPQRKFRLADERKLAVSSFNSSYSKFLQNIETLFTVPTIRVPPFQRAKGSDYGQGTSNDDGHNSNDAEGGNDSADLGDEYFDNNLDDNVAGPSNANIAGPPNLDPAGRTNSSTDRRMSLIEAPEKVPQLSVPYAKKAKTMDMKKLKQAVWCTLTRTPQYVPSAKVVPTTFSQMYKGLPKQLTEKMKQDLSGPLAFVSLLHLCNEHNLELKQEADKKSDFQIFGPADDVHE